MKKKTSFHMIMFLILISIFIPLSIPYSNDEISFSSINTKPFSANNPPDGYVESNFTTIYLNESAIHYDEQQLINIPNTVELMSDLIYATNNYISCSIPIINYPENNNSLWHFALPEGYTDSTEYIYKEVNMKCITLFLIIFILMKDFMIKILIGKYRLLQKPAIFYILNYNYVL